MAITARVKDQARRATGVKSSSDVHAEHLTPVERFGLLVANGLGTMVCALLFALLALVSLPSVLRTGDLVALVAWIAQTFIQLVALALLAYQNNYQAKHAEIGAEMEHVRGQRIEVRLGTIEREVKKIGGAAEGPHPSL